MVFLRKQNEEDLNRSLRTGHFPRFHGKVRRHRKLISPPGGTKNSAALTKRSAPGQYALYYNVFIVSHFSSFLRSDEPDGHSNSSAAPRGVCNSKRVASACSVYESVTNRPCMAIDPSLRLMDVLAAQVRRHVILFLPSILAFLPTERARKGCRMCLWIWNGGSALSVWLLRNGNDDCYFCFISLLLLCFGALPEVFSIRVRHIFLLQSPREAAEN